MQPTRQDIQTLSGVILSIAEGRKGPARGGVLDGAEAEMLRTLLAEHARAGSGDERSPVRGLSRLLRRNPTDAERALWDSVDQRTAALPAMASSAKPRSAVTSPISCRFRCVLVIDLAPDDEGAEAVRHRSREAGMAARAGLPSDRTARRGGGGRCRDCSRPPGRLTATELRDPPATLSHLGDGHLVVLQQQLVLANDRGQEGIDAELGTLHFAFFRPNS